ncbi:recombinase family protein [Bengtsoniella intestinalis]|uniref:recombinase family protein n=1 Tax=Bengtsoniella intestinalis TaxID=3073143 RepID=UPI00391F86EC
MKVWLYTRLSREENESIENQLQILQDYGAQHGCTIVGQSGDNGISGMEFRREGLNQLSEAVEQGEMDAVLVKDFSRLGRCKVQTDLYIQWLLQHNIQVISVTESLNSGRETDDFGISVRGLMNDFYAKDTGKKIRHGIRQRQKEGQIQRPSFGYWKDKNTDKIEIDEPAAQTVLWIFEAYLMGRSLKSITKHLNDTGEETPSQRKTILRGETPSPAHWTYTSVKNILSDESYVGILHTHKRERKGRDIIKPVPKDQQFCHENAYQPLVSMELWQEVQERLAQQPKQAPTNRTTHDFAGLLQCGDCGAPFVSVKRTWNGKERVEYTCKTYHNHGKAHCSSHRIHEEVLHQAVQELLTKNHESTVHILKQVNGQRKKLALQKPLRQELIAELRLEVVKLEEEIEGMLMERMGRK